MRVIGLNVSRTFGEIAYLKDDHLRAGGRVMLQHDALQKSAQGLQAYDEVVLEAAGNTTSIVTALKPHVAKVGPCARRSRAPARPWRRRRHRGRSGYGECEP